MNTDFYLSALILSTFRSYDSLRADFSPGINCIFGKNGAGKTNILDALHFLSLTRGFRSTADKQAVKEGEAYFMIEGQYHKRGENQNTQCNFLPGKGKKILVNGVPLTKMSTHIGELPLVSILPEDTEMIKGGSTLRRAFLDTLIAQYDKEYLNALIFYKKILDQRNALLKWMGENKTFDKDQLQIWTEQLIPRGIQIVQIRNQFLEDFTPYFTGFFHKIVSESETPEISYLPSVSDNTVSGWQEAMEKSLSKDRALEITSTGTHKDDLSFKIHGREAKTFGSQGQQKTFVISLKLAEHKLITDKLNCPPILLLDDIFDKLDEHRLKSIAEILGHDTQGQIFITDTSYERLHSVFTDSPKEVQYFQVKNHTLKGYSLE